MFVLISVVICCCFFIVDWFIKKKYYSLGLGNCLKNNKQFFFRAANYSMLAIMVLFLETPTQLQIINWL